MPEYTLATAITIIAVVALEVAVLKSGIFKKAHFYVALAIMFSFQVLVDGWLTKLSNPIVIYNEDKMLGIRWPLDIPIEDFGFGFAMIVLTLSIWQNGKNRARRDGQIVTDPKAVCIEALPGASRSIAPTAVTVIGGGIAGLAAALGLAERGINVTVIEPHAELGGRVRAWREDDVTMSRGFHAFFRQYYNLRRVLSRAAPAAEMFHAVRDYPVVSALGDSDSFSKIPRQPPFNFISFVIKSPTFKARDLTRVDIDAALSLLDVDFPYTYEELGRESAAEFLDRLRFPDRARHLALEVFARSFFADPNDFSAGELVAMFHAYFLGSAEGLLFDVPRDDFETSIWGPMKNHLKELGVEFVRGEATRVAREADAWLVEMSDSKTLPSDGVVIAAGPRASKQIVLASPDLNDLHDAFGAIKNAPPFGVWRLWLDKKAADHRPPFIGTAGFGPLDNISLLEKYEEGAKEWSEKTGGSVVELHAYALKHTETELIKKELHEEFLRVYPEFEGYKVMREEFLIEDDCVLMQKGEWADRPGVETSLDSITFAGDWVRSELPVALMERAATTGLIAANSLLKGWGIAGHDIWSVPLKARQAWPGIARELLKKVKR